MLRKYIILFASISTLCGCGDSSAKAEGREDPASEPNIEAKALSHSQAYQQAELPMITSQSGYYLCGRFAQHHHDWENASRFLEKVLEEDQENLDLMKRAMVLSMGSGNAEEAIRLAHELNVAGHENSLVQLFLALESFSSENYPEAVKHLNDMPEGGMADFINPLLKAWAAAAKGQLEIEDFPGNPVHSFHAALIAGYLGEHGAIPGIMDKALKSSGISLGNMEDIGDIYARAGRTDEAIEAYSTVLKENPGNTRIARKIDEVKNGDSTSAAESSQIETPKDGVAKALYDMARVLFGEFSDDSARVFSQMALYLNPEMNEARILIAVIDTRNDRYTDAIAQYQAIGDGDRSWSDARKRTAELMAKVDRTEEAVTILRELVKRNEDIDAQIQIGDIYRQQDNFDDSLEAYNLAVDMIGEDARNNSSYWHLFYARGMTLERIGRWKEAEQDLLVALAHQPDHPYIMNYLGYGWTENGIKYDEALELLQKAAALQPSDGYISDSLGWIYYHMSKYEQAIPHLEKSVELLPYDPVINDHLGDAYWQAGRHLEAEFQWQRAKNYSEDDELTIRLRQKLISGLKEPERIREAKGELNEN